MSDLIHPHDHFFRDVFSRPDAAADFLRYYLPPAVAAVLDPDSLRIAKDSFLDADLNAHYSDLLYRAGLRDGGEAFVGVLFEHKSYVEPRVGLDLLRYELRVWEDVLKATPQPATLPVIIPLVVYHGRARWTVPTRFDALLPAPTALQGKSEEISSWMPKPWRRSSASRIDQHGKGRVESGTDSAPGFAQCPPTSRLQTLTFPRR